MAKTQSKPLSGENQSDLPSLLTTIQFNLEELFEGAHDHGIRSTVPSDRDGMVGDIVLYESGAVTKLYVKFKAGWRSIALS